MKLARILIEKPLFAWLLILASLIGGLISYEKIGKLEDPNFTIKTALIVTPYPGASAKQVELELTDKLESAIQQLDQVDYIESRSMAGFSEIRVQVRDEYRTADLPQVWDELRRQVNDTQNTLPPGAGPSQVLDRFGDVYGMFYAITGEGYSPSQLYSYARTLRQQLLLIPDVADIVISGQQQEQILIEVDQSKLVANNLSLDDLANTIGVQNELRPSGRENWGQQLIRIAPNGTLDSVEQVRMLPIGNSASPLKVGDIATVRKDYASIPTQIIRYNGKSALTIGISARPGVNVVKVGEEVNQKLQELTKDRPLGVELHNLYDQPQIVDESVKSFVFDVFLSVSVVGIVLCLGLGWRTGIILAIELFLSVLATVAIMFVVGIELHRVSLGALIIVMGMLTDNTIVVCEGMLVRVTKGMGHIEAAGEIFKNNFWILLASTIVGILAFSGIGLSPDSVGEFSASLFYVAAISLLISWIIAIVLSPLLGKYFLRQPDVEPENPFNRPIYQRFKNILVWITQRRLGVLGGLAGLTLLSIIGFRQVDQGFFPASTTPIFYVDMHMPRGTDIRATDELIRKAEKIVQKREEVVFVSTYVGGGATRFVLVYDPETRDPAYAQLIVKVKDVNLINDMMPQLYAELNKQIPAARWTLTRPSFGPNSGAVIQARFSGPDPAELRKLSQQAQDVFHQHPDLISIRDDWDAPSNAWQPILDEDRARASGVTRRAILDTYQYATEGLLRGIYRENDLLYPIIVKSPDTERGLERLADLQVFSQGANRYLPISSVMKPGEFIPEENRILRRDRNRTITVKANPDYGLNSIEVFNEIKSQIEAIPLPQGYRMEWGGEYEASSNAQESLFRQLPLGLIGMAVLVLLMFGRLKPAAIVLLIVPMSICGVTLGLLLFRGTFGFIALLGLLSLFGMLIKNATMVVEEIDRQITEGVPRQTALLEGTMSRLRPVGLAAGTTILGMLPLLWDEFFYDMAITMMAGLVFATVLTLAAVPALYAWLYKIDAKEVKDTQS